MEWKTYNKTLSDLETKIEDISKENSFKFWIILFLQIKFIFSPPQFLSKNYIKFLFLDT